MKGSWSKGATPGFSDGEKTDSNAILTDGGLDAETVANTVAPGDVVVIAGRPHRVVEQEAALLFSVDMTQRLKDGATVEASACGDVDEYLHRTETEEIAGRVASARMDKGDGVETDGGTATLDTFASAPDAGVGDEDDECPNGEVLCPGPDGDALACFDCFRGAGGDA